MMTRPLSKGRRKSCLVLSRRGFVQRRTKPPEAIWLLRFRGAFYCQPLPKVRKAYLVVPAIAKVTGLSDPRRSIENHSDRRLASTMRSFLQPGAKTDDLIDRPWSRRECEIVKHFLLLSSFGSLSKRRFYGMIV